MRLGAVPLDRGVLKAIFLVCLADGIVGLSYGSLAAADGFPLWVPIALSTLVLAGHPSFIYRHRGRRRQSANRCRSRFTGQRTSSAVWHCGERRSGRADAVCWAAIS